MADINLSKNTTIGLSIGLVAALVLGSVAIGRAHANLINQLESLRDTQTIIVEQNQAMKATQDELKEALREATEDRWTRSNMRSWIRQFREDNKDLKVPFVEDH